MESLLIVIYIYLSVVGINTVIATTVSICWFVYLVKKIVYRRNLLKSSLEQNKINLKSLSFYNNETFLVRDRLLLALLIVEWLGLFLCAIPVWIGSLQTGHDCVNRKYNGSKLLLGHANLSDFSCYVSNIEIQKMNSEVNSSFLLLSYGALIMCTVLVISLCKYLTARYARLSWIKSNSIPYFIFSSMLIVIILNLLKFVCYLFFLCECLLWVFEVILLGIIIREMRRLLMVMDWNNTDLSISQNLPNYLSRSKLMKERFKKLIIIVLTGGFLFVLHHFIRTCTFGTELILNFIYNHPEKRSFCKVHTQYIPLPVMIITYFLILSSLILAVFMNSFPYYFTSIYIACVLCWRRFRGESGFKTHYSYKDLKNPLI